jgi:hypothetical protein
MLLEWKNLAIQPLDCAVSMGADAPCGAGFSGNYMYLQSLFIGIYDIPAT